MTIAMVNSYNRLKPSKCGKEIFNITVEKHTSLFRFSEVQWLVMATIPFLSIRHRRVTSRVPWPPSTNTVFPSKETSEKWFNLTSGHYSGKRNCWPAEPALGHILLMEWIYILKSNISLYLKRISNSIYKYCAPACWSTFPFFPYFASIQ